MHTTIERELALKLVLSGDRSVPVPARLRYRADDPYAVHMSFHINSDAPVDWAFSRELLVEGLVRPSGQGDVRLWPVIQEDGPVLCLALHSPDGDALLHAPAPAVAAWLQRTLRLVPFGTESERLPVDDTLYALLGAPDGSDEPAA
ncbi:SsgA family sporulation/cell division regulator [Streptomyces sp. PT12]|uniref:SsgA family sporulation/cell division regulator n=1 Tax=Streptomyces sp. PT12 TaxID=1510197 RepID=UPI000DE2D450|nr:SsgA family sporulation/cell division regulator [Streptomyces sp. PT12]RBM21429.1 SsgA family sporulation/cell division regulator [Streptomyces sp. PT12]